MTGKLAALGIDEDLELSGGEEENEDPAAVVSAAAPPGGRVSPPPPASPPKEAGGGEANTEPPPVDAGGEGGGGIEDGELLELLEKPLRTSRGRPQQRGSRDSNNRGGRDCGSGGGGGGQRKGGDGRGRRKPKSNGRALGRNVTIKECATWMCERLGEPKYYLMCRVVATIGYTKTKSLLEKVQETQVRNIRGNDPSRKAYREMSIRFFNPNKALRGGVAVTDTNRWLRCLFARRLPTCLLAWWFVFAQHAVYPWQLAALVAT